MNISKQEAQTILHLLKTANPLGLTNADMADKMMIQDMQNNRAVPLATPTPTPMPAAVPKPVMTNDDLADKMMIQDMNRPAPQMTPAPSPVAPKPTLGTKQGNAAIPQLNLNADTVARVKADRDRALAASGLNPAKPPANFSGFVPPASSPAPKANLAPTPTATPSPKPSPLPISKQLGTLTSAPQTPTGSKGLAGMPGVALPESSNPVETLQPTAKPSARSTLPNGEPAPSNPNPPQSTPLPSPVPPSQPGNIPTLPNGEPYPVKPSAPAPTRMSDGDLLERAGVGFGGGTTQRAIQETQMAEAAQRQLPIPEGAMDNPLPAAPRPTAPPQPTPALTGDPSEQEMALFRKLHGGKFDPRSSRDAEMLKHLRAAGQEAGGYDDFKTLRNLAYANQYGNDSDYGRLAQKWRDGRTQLAGGATPVKTGSYTLLTRRNTGITTTDGNIWVNPADYYWLSKSAAYSDVAWEDYQNLDPADYPENIETFFTK